MLICETNFSPPPPPPSRRSPSTPPLLLPFEDPPLPPLSQSGGKKHFSVNKSRMSLENKNTRNKLVALMFENSFCCFFFFRLKIRGKKIRNNSECFFFIKNECSLLIHCFFFFLFLKMYDNKPIHFVEVDFYQMLILNNRNGEN